jgi:hypothetical protein
MDRFPLTRARMGVSGDDTSGREDETAVMALRIHEWTTPELPIGFRAGTIHLEPERAADCRLGPWHVARRTSHIGGG